MDHWCAQAIVSLRVCALSRKFPTDYLRALLLLAAAYAPRRHSIMNSVSAWAFGCLHALHVRGAFATCT